MRNDLTTKTSLMHSWSKFRIMKLLCYRRPCKIGKFREGVLEMGSEIIANASKDNVLQL